MYFAMKEYIYINEKGGRKCSLEITTRKYLLRDEKRNVLG